VAHQKFSIDSGNRETKGEGSPVKKKGILSSGAKGPKIPGEKGVLIKKMVEKGKRKKNGKQPAKPRKH